MFVDWSSTNKYVWETVISSKEANRLQKLYRIQGIKKKIRFYNATCLDETLINNKDLLNWCYTSPDSICSYVFIQYFQLNPQ